MTDNKLNIIFSDLATQKIAEMSSIAQEKIHSFFQLNSALTLKSNKNVKQLNNDFYTFRVDNENKVIFTFEDEQILITDIANYSNESNLLLPDLKTLEYYRKIDPTAVKRILKLAEKEREHRLMIEKEILKKEDQFEKIGLVFAVFLTVIGLAISLYLIFTTEKTTVSIIILLTTFLPNMWRLMTKSKIKK